MTKTRIGLMTLLGPGILIAATGVGAGDLATASLSGSELGVAILWAVLVGAGIKFVLNEGLTRWQLATGTTLLEGAVAHFGRTFLFLFLGYYLIWTFLVAAALMSACGVSAHAILPLFGGETDKIVYGIAHSLVGVFLVRLGGYKLFEKIMGVCIAVMFATVMITACFLLEDLVPVLQGMVWPRIPQATEGGTGWTVALMGGVGGTVTILCYGYWIEEKGRTDISQLGLCRIDLGIGYTVTALFGLAMVIIGSTVEVEGRGVGLIVALAARLEGELGQFAKWSFLLGAWAAIASSLLGVWQSVPYLFADFLGQLNSSSGAPEKKVDTESRAYRYYLYGLATIPILGLWVGFAKMQRSYAILGAAFLPILALVLLRLNGRIMAIEHRNRPRTVIILSATLVFFLVFFLFVLF